MGMSATQARLLSLTSRMNDLEYRAENIANIKIRLADESDRIAQKYTDALGKQKFTLTTYSDSQHMGQAYTFDLRVSNLSANGLRLMRKIHLIQVLQVMTAAVFILDLLLQVLL